MDSDYMFSSTFAAVMIIFGIISFLLHASALILLFTIIGWNIAPAWLLWIVVITAFLNFVSHLYTASHHRTSHRHASFLEREQLQDWKNGALPADIVISLTKFLFFGSLLFLPVDLNLRIPALIILAALIVLYFVKQQILHKHEAVSPLDHRRKRTKDYYKNAPLTLEIHETSLASRRLTTRKPKKRQTSAKTSGRQSSKKQPKRTTTAPKKKTATTRTVKKKTAKKTTKRRTPTKNTVARKKATKKKTAKKKAPVKKRTAKKKQTKRRKR